MRRAKNPLHKEELAIKVKNYRNTILKLNTNNTNIFRITNWIYLKHGRESGKSSIYPKRGQIISTAFKLEEPLSPTHLI